VIHGRYERTAWIGDAVLGGVGAGLLGLWTAVLIPAPWAILPGLGFLGSAYLIARGLWLNTVTYRLGADGLLVRQAAGVADKVVALKDIQRADIHYLGTLLRGARGKSGLFVLHVADTATSMRIESKVETFYALANAVFEAHIAAGHPISLATYDNAQALELDAGLKTEMISRPV